MSILSPQELVRSDSSLFTLPKVFHELQSALQNPEISFNEIGKIISHDPSLSARLLKIVNSSFYGFESQVDTLTHALTIVGIDQLSDLAMATQVIHQFKGIPSVLFSMEKFWRHSIACGLAAKTLAQMHEESNAERFYLAGILHDLGRLVILHVEPALAKETFLASKSNYENICLSEQTVMGFDHGEVGGELLRLWKLPPRLVEAVAFHHFPEGAGEYSKEASIVHTADFLAHHISFVSDAEFSEAHLHNDSWNILDMDPEKLEFLKSEVESQFENISQMFLS